MTGLRRTMSFSYQEACRLLKMFAGDSVGHDVPYEEVADDDRKFIEFVAWAIDHRDALEELLTVAVLSSHEWQDDGPLDAADLATELSQNDDRGVIYLVVVNGPTNGCEYVSSDGEEWEDAPVSTAHVSEDGNLVIHDERLRGRDILRWKRALPSAFESFGGYEWTQVRTGKAT